MNATEPNPTTTKPRGPARWGWGAALLVVVLAWAGAFALRHGGENVALVGWVDGLEAGQAKSAELGRPMIVLFTADWCGYCQTMKREVLNQPEVDRVLRGDFVPVVVDATNMGIDDPALVRYEVKGLPTVIAVTPGGEPIDRFSGARTVAGFGAWLDEIER